MQFDLVVVGASFAGLAAARTAASRGLAVAVIESKREAGARIHTSGILVREAIEEIDIPHHLTRRVPGVRLYAPNLRSSDLVSPGYAFYTTRTADLLRWMAREAKDAGAHLIFNTRFEGGRRDGDLIRLDSTSGELVALVDPETWAGRELRLPDVSAHQHGLGRELFAGFRRLAHGAEQGGGIFFADV